PLRTSCGRAAREPTHEIRVHPATNSWTMHAHDAHRAVLAAAGNAPRPMNPARGSVAPTRIEVRVGHQEMLPGRLWAAAEPRAVVAVLHGLGEHCGRYAALASDLAQAGFSVAAVDLPGHGEARGPRGDMRSWTTVRDNAVHALWTAPLAQPDDPAELP